MYGTTFMNDIFTAFSSPSELRAILPPHLRNRFDWWVHELGTVQLDFFQETA